MKKLTFLSILILPFLLNSVSAEETDAIEPLMNRRKEQTQERVAQMCAKAEEIRTRRMENYDKNKENHLNVFNNLYIRLEGLSIKLADKGYDVSKLNEDLLTFKSKSDEYAAKYDMFISKLGESSDLVCGESDGMFRSKMIEAKQELADAKRYRYELRKFYVDVIREDLKELRSQEVSVPEVSEDKE